MIDSERVAPYVNATALALVTHAEKNVEERILGHHSSKNNDDADNALCRAATALMSGNSAVSFTFLLIDQHTLLRTICVRCGSLFV